MDTDFQRLIREGERVPLDGWDFSWFEGRATEERPPWGYAGLLSDQMATSRAALDVQTGGGEVLAGIRQPPPVLLATESWPPNVALAQRRLNAVGGYVVQADDRADLPFRDCSFDLVASRHPTVVQWTAIARVLTQGGTYLSQLIGPGSNRELTDFFMGAQPVNQQRSPRRAREGAEAAGLRIVELEHVALRVEFFDIGAVVHFLRKVLWTVPGFTVEQYRGRLAQLHDQIRVDGLFAAHSQRLLVRARKAG